MEEFQEEIKLLKDTNPKAFEELLELRPEAGYLGIKKEEIRFDSTLFAIWQCPSMKHTYITRVYHRGNPEKDIGCPICLNQKLGLNPVLLEHRLHDTSKVLIHESLWYCKKCHVINWERRKENTFDNSEHDIICEEEPTFKELYPDMAEEWCDKNEFKANELYPSLTSNYDKNIIWKCKKCNYEYKATMQFRVRYKNLSCPFCNGKLPFYEDSLEAKYPEVAARWNKTFNELPASLVFTDKEQYGHIGYFTCPECGTTYYNRITEEIHKKECPFCKAGLTKEQSDRIYREYIGNSEEFLDPKIKAVRHWKCEVCGSNFDYSPIDRFLHQKGCPFCAGKEVRIGMNSLDVTNPELAKEWSDNNELTASEVLATSSRSVLWVCSKCGGEYQYPIKDREPGDDSCPYCNNKKVLPGFNSLADMKPELLAEWSSNNNEEPIEFLATSSHLALWICPQCGGEYQYPIRDRKPGDDSCPYCNNKKVLPGFNSFKICYPELMKEWHFKANYLIAEPDHILASYNNNVWWKCSQCGYTYKMSPKKKLYYQKRHMKACPFCKGRRRKKHHII